jgi:hypothetical protein
MQKKYLIILLVVVLLIIIVIILPKSKTVNNNKPAQKQTVATTPEKAAIDAIGKASAPSFAPMTAIPPAQVPQAMPKNLPFETGAKILQNFEIKDPSGKTQSTRSYVSQKTIDDNYAIYQKYIKDNAWTVVSGLSQPTVKNIDATKASARLDITISQNPAGQVTVNVTYVN